MKAAAPESPALHRGIYDSLLARREPLNVLGLGFVGLPLAVAFSGRVKVLGFDVSERKIAACRAGRDATGELGDAAVARSGVEFSADPASLRAARFHVVAVPTPVTADKRPDFGAVHSACEILGRNLRRGSVVVFESTWYPGATRKICVPALEAASGMKSGSGFHVAYAPERMNPGDRVHTIANIVKVVSAFEGPVRALVAKVYGLIVGAGVHEAESVEVAEAAKVIENCQRDLNIAFMNELSLIFARLGLDTQAVLRASRTRWNWLDFSPGLVGGHCVGVDPYYLTHCAQELGYHAEVILAGRRINDRMGTVVAEACVKRLAAGDRPLRDTAVLVLGMTFKENVPDVRNSRVADLVAELARYGIDATASDPHASPEEVRREYGITLKRPRRGRYDAVVLAVAHDEYRALDLEALRGLCRGEKPLLADVKGLFTPQAAARAGFAYWSL